MAAAQLKCSGWAGVDTCNLHFLVPFPSCPSCGLIQAFPVFLWFAGMYWGFQGVRFCLQTWHGVLCISAPSPKNRAEQSTYIISTQSPPPPSRITYIQVPHRSFGILRGQGTRDRVHGGVPLDAQSFRNTSGTFRSSICFAYTVYWSPPKRTTGDMQT